MGVVGRGTNRGKPLRGEHHASLGIGARAHRRGRIAYRAVVVDGNRGVQRSVTPRAHIVASHNALPRRHGQR